MSDQTTTTQKRPTLQIVGAIVAGAALLAGTFLAGRLSAGSGSAPASAGTADTEEVEVAATQDVFRAALNACRIESTTGELATIGDGGLSLSLEHRGEDDISGLDISQVMCVLNELEVPDRVITDMEHDVDGWAAGGYLGRDHRVLVIPPGSWDGHAPLPRRVAAWHTRTTPHP